MFNKTERTRIKTISSIKNYGKLDRQDKTTMVKVKLEAHNNSYWNKNKSLWILKLNKKNLNIIHNKQHKIIIMQSLDPQFKKNIIYMWIKMHPYHHMPKYRQCVLPRPLVMNWWLQCPENYRRHIWKYKYLFLIGDIFN